jgi:hypothetical protein
MHFIILFEDNPSADPDIRRTLMPDHLAFLEVHADAIRAAGPLFERDGPAGGLWLVCARSEEEAERLIRKDPFWPTGLRKSWRILRWQQVFAEGARVPPA